VGNIIPERWRIVKEYMPSVRGTLWSILPETLEGACRIRTYLYSRGFAGTGSGKVCADVKGGKRHIFASSRQPRRLLQWFGRGGEGMIFS